MMGRFVRLPLCVLIAGLLALGQPTVARAHEGEMHLTEGFVLTPLTIAIFGGAVGVLLLTGFLVWAWASWSIKKKEQKKQQLHAAGSNTITSERDKKKQEG